MDRFSIDAYEPEDLNTDLWPEIDTEGFEEATRGKIKRAQTGIKLLISGSSDKVIRQEARISRGMAIYWFKRCMKMHSDGNIWGFRVLAPHTHTKEYTRTKELPTGHQSETAGWAGALGMLFAKYPTLKQLVDRHIIKKHPKTHIYEARIKLKAIHKRMLNELQVLLIDKCRVLGIPTDELYPLNTDTLGHRALSNYIRREMVKRAEPAIAANFGTSSLKTLQTGDGTKKPLLRPFDRIEADAHKIDGIWTVHIPSIYGEVIARTVDRVWDIVLKEPVTDVVLCHHLCYGKEINSQDFLEAVHKALTPKPLPPLRIPTLKYRDSAGFPSALDSRFVGAKFREMSVDGALAEGCNKVTGKLRAALGCETITIHRRNPNDREIEGYFSTLEEDGFHRLPNTTGAGPKDSRRRDPEKAALRHQMQLEDLSELLDVMHANHNVKPSTALGGRTPIGYLKHLCETTDCWPKQAPVDDLDELLVIRHKVRVVGSLEKGIRPYINFAGVRYTSSILRGDFRLVGEELTLSIPIDIRTVSAFTSRGAGLGPLTAANPWNRTPHTLQMRKAILKVQRSRQMLDYVKNNDPVIDYLLYLEDSARKGKVIPPHYLTVRNFISERSLGEGTPDLTGTSQSLTPRQIAASSSRSSRSPLAAMTSALLLRKGVNG
jgi:putative transposase